MWGSKRSLELNAMRRTVRNSTLVRKVAAETGVLLRLRTISLLLAWFNFKLWRVAHSEMCCNYSSFFSIANLFSFIRQYIRYLSTEIMTHMYNPTETPVILSPVRSLRPPGVWFACHENAVTDSRYNGCRTRETKKLDSDTKVINVQSKSWRIASLVCTHGIRN